MGTNTCIDDRDAPQFYDMHVLHPAIKKLACLTAIKSKCLLEHRVQHKTLHTGILLKVYRLPCSGYIASHCMDHCHHIMRLHVTLSRCVRWGGVEICSTKAAAHDVNSSIHCGWKRLIHHRKVDLFGTRMMDSTCALALTLTWRNNC